MLDLPIPQELVCPIACQKIDDPVIARDGFTYDKNALNSWFSSSSISPMIGNPLESKEIIENKSVSYLLNRFDYYSRSASHIKKIKANPVSYEMKPLPKELKQNLVMIRMKYLKLSQPLSTLTKKLDTLLLQYPECIEILVEYANIKRFENNIDRAFELIQLALKLKPNSNIAKCTKARLELIKGNILEAQSILEEIQFKTPLIDQTLLEVRYFASLSLHIYAQEASLALINAYMSLFPNDVRGQLSQIYGVYALNDMKKVLELTKTFFNQFGYDTYATYYRAHALSCLQKKTDAIREFDCIIKNCKEPSFLAKCYYERAMLRNLDSEFIKIEEELIIAHNLTANCNADATLANLFREKHNYEEAQKWLKIYGERITKEQNTLYNKLGAVINEKLGNNKEAIRCYETLVKIDSNKTSYYYRKISSLM